jgi:tRNA-dihydrouridine synthase B
MERGFWADLSHPILGLSPMDGVTDAAFRFMVAKHGKPAVMMTEFTAAEGIRAGADRLLTDFLYNEIERPIAAQIFGSDPDAFRISAAVAAALGFDGVDINMGCPAKNVAEKGAGAGLIRDPERAKAIIRATRQGIKQWAEGMSLEEIGVADSITVPVMARRQLLPQPYQERRVIPVSVKTRIGYDSIVIADWVQHLLEEAPVTITIHGRTLKQLYTGEANWEAIGQAAHLIRQTPTLVLGNGDVRSVDDAVTKCTAYGTHGALLGRASYGNPWIFSGHEATWEERLAAALEHSRHLNTLFEGKAFIRMRKHLMDYTKGFDGARELRQQLMKVTTLAEVEAILVH